MNPPRVGDVQRDTKETQIHVRVNLDGQGDASLATGIGFFDHMLDQIARHGLIDLDVQARGDLHCGGGRIRERTGHRRRERRDKASECGERFRRHQKGCAVCGGDVADLIVLALIEVIEFDKGHGEARSIDGIAKGEEPLMVLPRDEFRRGNGCASLCCGRGEEADGIRGECDVVVAEQVVRGALDHLRHDVGGCAIPDGGIEATNVCARRNERDALENGLGRSIVDDEDRKCRVILGDERREGVVECRARVAGDHDGDDGRDVSVRTRSSD